MSNIIFKTLGFVMRTASDLRLKVLLKTLYCVMVRPNFEHGSIVWNLHYIYESYFLMERVQRRLLRFTCFVLCVLHVFYVYALPSCSSL